MPDKVVSQANVNRSRIKRVAAAATTNATSVNAVPSAVDGYDFYNKAATAVFVKFYDKATAPTVGTDVPAFVVGIPAGARATSNFDKGLQFNTGLAYAIVTGVADADATAVALNDVQGVIAYR